MSEAKVGLLLPYTGVDAAQGTDVTRGFELYLDRVCRRTGGRSIRTVKADDKAMPDVALAMLKQLIEIERVDFLVGPISSAVALAIHSYVREQGTPLVVPAAFTRVLTSRQNAAPNIFRVSETSDQANYPMGRWIMKHSNYRRVVVMAADFAGGRHSVEAFMAGLRASDGEVVAQFYPPFGTRDFAPYLREAGMLGADAVYAWFAGDDAIHFVNQYRKHAINARLPLTGHSALTADTILPAMGHAALGIVAVGSYSAAIETPGNRDFVGAYDAAYKAPPSRYSECGWIAARLITAALDALDGDLSNQDRVRKKLRDALPKIDPPRGTMRFDKYGQAITPIYITRTEKRDRRIINAIIDTIPHVSQEMTWGWWDRD